MTIKEDFLKCFEHILQSTTVLVVSFDVLSTI